MKTLILRLVLRCIISALLCLQSINLFAQETDSCAVKLKLAQLNFAKGQLDQIPGLLTGCLKSGFKKEDALSAFKLLIQTYMLGDKPEQADSAMLIFLKRNPEYKLSPTDHSSFVYIFNKYEVRQVIQLSVRTGIGYPFLTFINERLTYGEQDLISSSFKTDASNLYLSAEARYKFNEKFAAGLEAGYLRLQFNNTIQYGNIGTISYTETLTRLEVPVNLYYNISTSGKFTPYALAGMGVVLNLSASADASVFYSDRLNEDRTGETLMRNDSRTGFDVIIKLGGGIKYKIPKGFFFAELRTGLGISNQYLKGGSTEQTLVNYYFWRDPDFNLNTLNFTAGWTYIFYKPSKRTGE
jgi:hypothetical protein